MVLSLKKIIKIIVLLLMSSSTYADEELSKLRTIYKNSPSPVIFYPDNVMNLWFESNYSKDLKNLLNNKEVNIKVYDSNSLECQYSRPSFSIDKTIGLCLNNLQLYMQIIDINVANLWLMQNYKVSDGENFEKYASTYYLKVGKKYIFQQNVGVVDVEQICSIWVLVYSYIQKKSAADCLNDNLIKDFSNWYERKIDVDTLSEEKNIASFIYLSTMMDRNILSFLILHEYAHIIKNHDKNKSFSQEEEKQADEYAFKRLSEVNGGDEALIIIMSFYFSSMYLTFTENAPPIFHRFNNRSKDYIELSNRLLKEMDDADFGSVKIRQLFKRKIKNFDVLIKE